MKNIKRIAVAYSGGADSTAALHMACQKYEYVVALIVDHALRDESSEEAEWCKQNALDIGADTAVVLKWEHNGIKTGVQNKARRARYGLMGDYCRENNIEYIITGHHYNDVLENVWMRKDKGYLPTSICGLRELAYAPVWPELKNVYLYRPYIETQTHQDMIDYCIDSNLQWVEDPSNQSDKYERNRTRKTLVCEDKFFEAANLLESATREAKQMQEYFYICFKSIKETKFSVEIPTKMMSKNSVYFGLFFRNLVMCYTGRCREPDLMSYNKMLGLLRSGKQSVFTLGGSKVKFTDNKIIVSVAKPKAGSKPISTCPDFMDRLSKRFI